MYRSEHEMPLIYDPDEFRKFCISAGAPSIFDNVLAAVATPRKSKKRIEKIKKLRCIYQKLRCIYWLCFANGQLNNGMQKDQCKYLMLKILTKRH